jgi:hypothetical protein
VQFEYAKAGTAPVTWLPVKDKNGVVQTLNVGTLNAGNSNFPDSDQNNPPSLASVKWCIPPLAAGDLVDHFCLRAKVTSSNDVNPYNNETQSNIAYSTYSPLEPAKSVFTVGNPLEKTIPIDLKVKTTLPKSWKVYRENFGEAKLRPGEERPFIVEIKMSSGADTHLETPLNGDIWGELHEGLSGPFTGSLTDTILRGKRLKGQFSANRIYSLAKSWPEALFHPRTIVGMFTGTINLDTGRVSGTVVGSYQRGKAVDRIKMRIEACLRPWRRVNISQWHNGDILGGVTIQVQVPWEKDPCTVKLPKTNTKVATRHRRGT